MFTVAACELTTNCTALLAYSLGSVSPPPTCGVSASLKLAPYRFRVHAHPILEVGIPLLGMVISDSHYTVSSAHNNNEKAGACLMGSGRNLRRKPLESGCQQAKPACALSLIHISEPPRLGMSS